MSDEKQKTTEQGPLFLNFIHLLEEYQIPLSMDYILEFYDGLCRGIVQDIDDLYLFARLCFIKEVKYFDPYDRAFALYFENIAIPSVEMGDTRLLETKEFRKWLEKAVKEGQFGHKIHTMTIDELMNRFWETVEKQMKEHHGGSKWVGTGGTSPWGHSGNSRGGIRVHGNARNFSAMKVIGERRYLDYSASNAVSSDHLDEAIRQLKNLRPSGAHEILDIDETIRQTARQGGEIELVMNRKLLDKLQVVLLLDNGGASMFSHVELVQKLFFSMKRMFRSLESYFFHNTIYGHVFRDPRRTLYVPLKKIINADPETRIFIIGDATMAPSELLSNYGNINWGEEEFEPSLVQLKRLKERMKYTVWLNPIPKERWDAASLTHRRIAEIIHMEDMTVGGLHNAVNYLNSR